MVGVFAIGASQLLGSSVGVMLLLAGMENIFGLRIMPFFLADAISYRAHEAGIGRLYPVWGLLYFSQFPVGIGLLLQKEWARRLTLFLLPLAIALSFPLIFNNSAVVIQKLRILFGLSKIIEVKDEFWPLLFQSVLPWSMYIGLVLMTIISLLKYLRHPQIKSRFQ